jgi:hypothetical protein
MSTSLLDPIPCFWDISSFTSSSRWLFSTMLSIKGMSYSPKSWLRLSKSSFTDENFISANWLWWAFAVWYFDGVSMEAPAASILILLSNSSSGSNLSLRHSPSLLKWRTFYCMTLSQRLTSPWVYWRSSLFFRSSSCFIVNLDSPTLSPLD